MKKSILYSLIFSFIGLSVISCDDMLNLTPKSSITVNSMWENSGDVKAVLNGAFNRFRSAYATNYIIWGDYRTSFYGNGVANGAVERGTVWNNQLIPSSPGTNWAGLYNAINDCNLVIKHTPNISFSSEAEKNHIIGSAHFLRAYMYYTIARIWGDAPVLTTGFESDDQEGLFPVRNSVNEVFDQIEKDLSDALNLVGNNGKIPFEVTKETICMLQTDFYLWQAKQNGKGSAAIEKANASIATVLQSGIKLSDSYENVFRDDDNDEIIFSIAFIEAENTTSFANDFLLGLADVPSEYYNNPIQVGSHAHWVSFTSKHKDFLWSVENDSRAPVNISDFTTSQGKYFSWINKYLGTWKEGTRIFDSDIRIYRYAEALLFKAEIEIARNNFSEALNYLNQIAKRAYKVDNYYSGTYTQSEIETILLDERLKEHATEGKAWFDLIRLGQVFNRIETLQGRENELNILLWPVNNASINTNPAITQTPGYE